jgi:hypothetical protein
MRGIVAPCFGLSALATVMLAGWTVSKCFVLLRGVPFAEYQRPVVPGSDLSILQALGVEFGLVWAVLFGGFLLLFRWWNRSGRRLSLAQREIEHGRVPGMEMLPSGNVQRREHFVHFGRRTDADRT